MIWLRIPLQVGQALRIKRCLRHTALRGTRRHQVLDILRAEARHQLADTGLLNAHLAKLAAQCAKLPRQSADALAQSALLLRHLHELVDVLLRQLPKLQAKLALLLRTLQAKLAKIGAQSADVLARSRLLPCRRQTKLCRKVLQLACLLNAR